MNTLVISFLLFPQGKGVEDTRPDSFVVSETHDTLDTPTVVLNAEAEENLTDTLLMLISWRVVLLPPGMSFNLAVRLVLNCCSWYSWTIMYPHSSILVNRRSCIWCPSNRINIPPPPRISVGFRFSIIVSSLCVTSSTKLREN
ncbi:hypothetical protein NC651_034382 [Populus alba x Populus x berolinensis]|nr:hypothetical protein NC651_034382 [Populus alba x Populus x berolinensis]